MNERARGRKEESSRRRRRSCRHSFSFTACFFATLACLIQLPNSIEAGWSALVFYFSSVFFCFFCLHHVNKSVITWREMRFFFAGSEREREPMYAWAEPKKKDARDTFVAFLSRVESIMRGQNAACDDAQIWVTSRRTRAREEEIHARAEMINR